MIGTSTGEYVFIRMCVFFLRAIAPFCIFYSLARFLRPDAFHAPAIFDIWAAAETVFYFLVYIPRKYALQKPTTHPSTVSREKRWLLFCRCSATVPDFERYLRGWFNGAPLSEIKRENLKEFLTWAFLNSGDVNEMDEDEFEDYIRDVEKRLGKEIQSGRGNAKCLRLSVDKVLMSHRSLLWYLCVFVVDSITSTRLLYHKFDYHRTSRRNYFSVFPLRPHNLFAKTRSPSTTLTYWHRPHTAKDKLPILFIHGIGIGLYPYVDFLSEIRGCHSDCPPKCTAPHSGVGIIAIEIMPISFRITSAALQKDEMCAQINRILAFHGWDKFVLVSHSYGSVITTHLLHTPAIAPKIGPLLLIDPVTFLLHLPDVAYNFITRKPTRANEHQLSYFASQDMGVAHTLSRCFFWSENILWKEDLAGRDVTVSLAGRDLITDTQTVANYLGGRGWRGRGVNVLWFERLDHAQVFDDEGDRGKLVAVLREYCRWV